MENGLVEGIGRVHTTEAGAERIARNIGLCGVDAAAWCREKILDRSAVIEHRGKNWYVRVDGCVITVNASSYTVITAHRAKCAAPV